MAAKTFYEDVQRKNLTLRGYMFLKSNEEAESTIEDNAKSFSNMIKGAYELESFKKDLETGFLRDVFKILPQAINTIYFEGNSIGSLDCNKIKLFTSLFESGNIRRLYLGNNDLWKLNAEGIAALIYGLENLEELHLNDNALGSIGTKNLEVLFNCFKKTNLKILDLSKNYLIYCGIKGINIIKEGIKDTHIQSFDMSDNGFEACTPKYALESILGSYAKERGIDLDKFKVMLREAGKLEVLNKAVKFKICQVETKIPTGTIKQFKPHTSLFELIEQKIKAGLDTVKKTFIDPNYNNMFLEALSNNGKVQQEPHLIIEPILQDLHKELAKNSSKHPVCCYTLKELCKFTIHRNDINWKKAPITEELKDELTTDMFVKV